jgi:hypothetical protein
VMPIPLHALVGATAKAARYGTFALIADRVIFTGDPMRVPPDSVVMMTSQNNDERIAHDSYFESIPV